MIDFIIINAQEDTKDFESLTHGFEEGNNILINPSKSAVRRLLRNSTNDLVLFGHGDGNGLYNVRMDGYVIGSKDVDLLRKRNVIGLVFVPTTNDALIIYGVGGTLEWVRDNDNVKQIPDKAVEALSLYLDNINADLKEGNCCTAKTKCEAVSEHETSNEE